MLYTAGFSDKGRINQVNEDSFFIDDESGLLIVADGMGGLNAGEIASTETVATVKNYIKEYMDRGSGYIYDRDVVKAALEYANRKLYERSGERGAHGGKTMGTTIVGLWRRKGSNYAITFNVGDSRLYMLRDLKMLQLTKDHTLYQQWDDYGQIGEMPSKNILLKAIGPNFEVTPDITIQYPHRDDLYLLCSDGLYNMIPDELIEDTLSKTGKESLLEACEQLVHLANNGGGKDNITAVIAIFQ